MRPLLLADPRSADVRSLPRFWMLFRSTTLLQHPFPDVSRTVQDRNARQLTRVEKPNAFEIDEVQFLQIQNDWRFAALDFGLDLIQVPNPKFAAQPNLLFDPFNPQRHFPRLRKIVTSVQVSDRLQ